MLTKSNIAKANSILSFINTAIEHDVLASRLTLNAEKRLNIRIAIECFEKALNLYEALLFDEPDSLLLAGFKEYIEGAAKRRDRLIKKLNELI